MKAPGELNERNRVVAILPGGDCPASVCDLSRAARQWRELETGNQVSALVRKYRLRRGGF